MCIFNGGFSLGHSTVVHSVYLTEGSWNPIWSYTPVPQIFHSSQVLKASTDCSLFVIGSPIPFPSTHTHLAHILLADNPRALTACVVVWFKKVSHPEICIKNKNIFFLASYFKRPWRASSCYFCCLGHSLVNCSSCLSSCCYCPHPCTD